MGKQSEYRKQAERQSKQVEFLTKGAKEMTKKPMKKVPGKGGKKPC